MDSEYLKSEVVVGIDLASTEGGPIDWQSAKKSAPDHLRFVMARAGVSWGYTDGQFAHNWKETRGLFERGAYHVIYPAENAVRQMEHFLQIVGDDLGELPLTLDVELAHGQSADVVGGCVGACIRALMERTGGRRVMVYSRASFIFESVLVNGRGWDWFDLVDWHLAEYNYDGSPRLNGPDLPVGVKSWRLHQCTPHGPALEGMTCHDLDWNRFNGSTADYARWLGIGTQPVEQAWGAALTEWARSMGYAGPGPE